MSLPSLTALHGDRLANGRGGEQRGPTSEQEEKEDVDAFWRWLLSLVRRRGSKAAASKAPMRAGDYFGSERWFDDMVAFKRKHGLDKK